MKERNERFRYGGRGQIGIPSNSFETQLIWGNSTRSSYEFFKLSSSEDYHDPYMYVLQ